MVLANREPPKSIILIILHSCISCKEKTAAAFPLEVASLSGAQSVRWSGCEFRRIVHSLSNHSCRFLLGFLSPLHPFLFHSSFPGLCPDFRYLVLGACLSVIAGGAASLPSSLQCALCVAPKDQAKSEQGKRKYSSATMFMPFQ